MSDPLSPPPGLRRPEIAWGWSVGFGLLLILLGAFAWFDVVATTLAGTVLIGAALLVGGVLQVMHALLDRDWAVHLLHLMAGVLYGIGGLVIMLEPVQGSIVLTLILAGVLIAGGAFRMVIAVRHWHLGGAGLLLIGGFVSLGVGAGLYLTLPWSGLWVLGTLIAVELIVHGAAWFEFGLALRRMGRD